MWFFIGVIALTAFLFVFYRRRLGTGETVRSKDRLKTEISSDIGIPLEAIDPEKSGKIDRRTGVLLPRARPPGEQNLPDDFGALSSKRLRKVNLSKEVELAWEAGEVIEFQKGAWAVPKDPSESGPKEPEHYSSDKEKYELPGHYGTSRLVLMARDPNWVYAYWEITHDKYKEMYEKHIQSWGLSRPVLRLYDLTDGEVGSSKLDFFISDQADSWYLNVGRPRHTFMAELGRLFPEDSFKTLATSNKITLPADDPSDEICPEWAPVDWDLIFGQFKDKPKGTSPGTWEAESR